MGVKQLKTNLELAGTTLQDAERNDQDPLMKYDIYIDYIYILTYINIIMRLTVTNQQYHVKIRSKS